MAFSLALVDFDGTLADSMPYWLRLPADTLRAAGLPQPEGFAEYIRSVPIREIARDMGAKYPQLEAETPLAVRWSAEMAAHYAREIPLKPGAKKLLQTLRAAGLRVYILSATRHALLDPAIERLGVAPLVDGVYAEEETGSKRTEAPYAFFRDRFGVPYEKMLLAEDAPRNLAAGGGARRFGRRRIRREHEGIYGDDSRRSGGVSAGLLRPFGAGGAAAAVTAERREPLRQPDGRRLHSQGRGVGYPRSCLLTYRTNKAGGQKRRV